MLLEYCELSQQLHPDQPLKSQVDALLIGSLFDSQWLRWRSTLCMARELCRHSNPDQAIVYAKLACQQVLSLSVPLLFYAAQRERIADELMQPFLLLENILCLSGAIVEAQSLRSHRVALDYQLRFSKPVAGDHSADIIFDKELQLKPTQTSFFKVFRAAENRFINYYEDGDTFHDAARLSGLSELVTHTVEPKQAEQKLGERTQSRVAVNSAQVYLYYWFSGSQLKLTATGPVDCTTVVLACTPQDLHRMVFELRVAMDEYRDWIPHVQTLYRLLIDPIEGQLAGVDTIIVSATHGLNLIPFSALNNGDRFLIEQYKVVLSHRPNGGLVSVKNQDNALLLGTTLHTNESAGLNPAKELAALEKKFQSVQSLVGSTWNLEKCATLLGNGVDVVHVCCHYVYSPDNPANSYFKLSEGRRLHVREFLALDGWQRVKLLFLATCNSAVGGDHLSLANLFIEAGVSGVVASLRTVNDMQSIEFCEQFYDNLQHTPEVHSTFRQTKTNTLIQRNAVWSAYEFWGGI